MIKNIKFFGVLSPNEISDFLVTSAALVCTSEYETFSVICAEALCTGTPVIVPQIDSIQEYTDDWNSCTFGPSENENLSDKVLNFDISKYDNERISKHFSCLFSPINIGKQYYDFICEKV